ncbi:MAG: hypothetical protein ACK2VD_20965 [Anaerolineae bacterium]
MGRALASGGDLRRAIPHYRRAVELTLQAGHAGALHYRLFWLGFPLLALGKIGEAEQHARAAVQATRELGVEPRAAWQYWLLGLVLFCKRTPEEAISALEQSLALADTERQPETALLSHHALGRMHLQAGEEEQALKHLALAADLSTAEHLATWHGPEVQSYALALVRILNGLEEAHGDSEGFRAYCRAFPARAAFSAGATYSPELALQQWFLESAEPDLSLQRQDLGGFGKPTRSDQETALSPGWTWIDPYGDCSYALDEGLEISAALGRDLWHVNWSAPRLLRPITPEHRAGFALQALCCAAREDCPAMGGLLLWVGQDHYLRLDWGSGGPREITLLGCLDRQDVLLGRGRLPPKSAGTEDADGHPGQAYLRIEYADGEVRALCSVDGERWYTAGRTSFALTEDAQCGVYAIGNIDRTIYSGAHAEGTAIRFASVQVWEC